MATGIQSGPRRRPNVLMIVSDDQRADTIGALGNPAIRTPNYDRLVRSGFALQQARCMIGNCPAVCIPARATLLTGRTVFHTPLNTGTFTLLPQHFRNHGYDTFGCGKWHNEAASFARSFSAGGRIFFGGMEKDPYRIPHYDFDPSGVYYQQRKKPTLSPPQFCTDLFTDAAAEFLEHHTPDRPFFCYIGLTSPHDPRLPPEPFASLYDPAGLPLPANFLPQHPFDNGELQVRDELLAPFPRTPDNTKRHLADYYGMVSANDAQLGRLLALLERRGMLEHTLVVVTGDHGLAIGSHGLFGKQNIYEHSIGIPMILAGPGVPHAFSRSLVYNLDLFPTLCELTELPLPETVEGRSFRELMYQPESPFRATTFHAYGMHGVMQRAVTDGRWKYHFYEVHGTQTRRLFDLAADPAEMHDLSRDPAASAVLERMHRLLQNQRREMDDPILA